MLLLILFTPHLRLMVRLFVSRVVHSTWLSYLLASQ
jgi:hypothetical protein